jgi:hypothetical protein
MDILFVILFIFFGFLFINSFKRKLSQNNIATLRQLFIYHLLFGVYFYFFVYGDSIGYWRYPKFMTFERFLYSFKEEQGTYFIYALNYFPSNVLDLSYFVGTMMYSVIGFIGLTYFFVTAIDIIPTNPKFNSFNLFPLLFFFPNLHFWSCAVGKDTLLFVCIALFCYGLLTPIKRIHFIIIGLVLSYFVRPHITLFMLLGFGSAYFSGKKLSIFQRFVFFATFIGIAFLIFPFVLKFTNIEAASIDAFQDFSTKKASLLSRSHTGSSIDISTTPVIIKIFSFLYRPFLFDINSIPSLLASIENSILLFLTFKYL